MTANVRTPRLDAATQHAINLLGLRFDANETIAFARELESLKAEVVEHEFPALRAREFVPMIPGVDPGAETFAWYEFSKTGIAEMLVNYQTALPRVAAFGTKNYSRIESVGLEFSYSVQDLRAAAMSGRPLDRMLAMIAREGIERKIDSVLALGDAKRGITGLANNSAIPLVTSGLTLNWDSSGADTILADLHYIAGSVWTQSKQIHKPDTMLVGTNTYQKLSTKIFSTYTGETVLSAFLKSSTMIKSVEPWTALDLADAGGDGERLICYERNPMNLGCIIPIDFETLPPQARGFDFVVPCEGRVGGTVVFRPLSAVYVDALMD